MDLFGISPLRLAQVAGVSLRTAMRWKRTGVPRSMERAVMLGVFGDLGELAGEWEGWKLWNGRLWSPEGDAFSPGQVRAIPYQRDRVRALEGALRANGQLALFDPNGAPIGDGIRGLARDGGYALPRDDGQGGTR